MSSPPAIFQLSKTVIFIFYLSYFFQVMWQQQDTCYYSLEPHYAIKKKTDYQFACFDFDDTLYKQDTTDFCHPTLLDQLICLHHQGFHIVVFSNQYGVSKGHTTLDKVKYRFEHFQRQINASIFFATNKDHYRKPCTGMFALFLQTSQVTKWNRFKSFYYGDAAGRVGDFAISDLYFAHNINLPFYLPGRHLRLEQTDPKIAPKFNLYSHLPLPMVCAGPSFERLPPLICVLMVGPPGAGKSTLAAQLPQPLEILNLDTLKTRARFNKQFTAALAARRSVCVDNTNGSSHVRAPYIAEARQQGYITVCYFFNYSKDMSTHLCHMRTQLGGIYIPPVARHVYYKAFEPPTDTEFDYMFTISGLTQPPPEYWFHYNLLE